MTLNIEIFLASLATVVALIAWFSKRVVKNMDEQFSDLRDGQEVIREDHRRTTGAIARIEVLLIGVNGENGLNSEVKELRRTTGELRRDVDRYVARDHS